MEKLLGSEISRHGFAVCLGGEKAVEQRIILMRSRVADPTGTFVGES